MGDLDADGWNRARLIPVSGIGSQKEAEARATSAFLAVLEAVRDLSTAMLGPLGASKAQRATVECFTEVPFKGAQRRPDGLIRVTYAKREWNALVEVKTGTAAQDADQVNAYWDLAREHGFDAVITISNEIAVNPDQHPTAGLKVKSNSKVSIHHFSWTSILSMCEVIREHRDVSDPEQAWILAELIRYLRHPNSGADPFDDMGPTWVEVRDGARDQNLKRSDDAVGDVTHRWDQLMRYAALRLEARIGEPVRQQLPAAQRDPVKRRQHLVDLVANDGCLDATLRIPNTAGDVELATDLRARRISASMLVSAPTDRGAKARCTWLAKQLDDDVDGRLAIESFPKNSSNPVTATTTPRQQRVRMVLTRATAAAPRMPVPVSSATAQEAVGPHMVRIAARRRARRTLGRGRTQGLRFSMMSTPTASRPGCKQSQPSSAA